MPNFTFTITVAQAASVFVIFIACVVLSGWVFDIALLKSVLPGLITMKINTAIAFLLSGLSLWLFSSQNTGITSSSPSLTPSLPPSLPPSSPSSSLLIAEGCATAVVFFGLVTLCQYLFGWNLEIDKLLFRDSPEAIETFHSRGMQVNTAVNFLLSGMALWLLRQKTQRSCWVAQGLSLIVALICLQAFIGYAYGVKNFYRFGVYTTSMALHTALAFEVLCVGVLYTHPDRGFMQTITNERNGGAIARQVIPSAIVLPLILGWLILLGQRTKQYDPEFSISLLVVSLIVIFLALIWRNAKLINRLDISERKQAEAERDRLFMLSVDMLCITGFDGYFKRINPAFEKILGYTQTELLTTPFIEFIHPKDRAKTLQEVEKLATGAVTLSFENRYRCKDGSYKWLVWNSVPDVELKLVYAVAHDITDRKQIEQTLREQADALRISTERLDLVIQGAEVGLWYCNLPLDKLIWNDQCKANFGLPPDAEVTIDLFYQLLHFDDREPTRQAIQASIEQAGGYDVDYRTVAPDGQVRWIRAIGRTFCDAAGTPKRFDGITIDISDRKRAEAALIESEQRFRHVTDTAPMMVWMSGTDKLCTYFNKPWLDFTGRTMEQELGNGWSQGVHPDDFQRCLETYTNTFDTRQEFRMEYRLQRFDGEYRWVLDIGVPRFTPEGEFLGYIGSCIDIEERKQAEAQIRQINETLEERVKQRTSQLEAANRELESFSYSVSHDLRAPLRHITGFVDLLQKRLGSTGLDDTSQRYVNIITEATKQAGKLIDDLLTFSRVGRSEMRHTTIDMNLLVREVQRDLISENKNRQVSWHIESLPQVYGDPSMLRLVLRNLLENSLKYSKTRSLAEITVGSTSSKQVVFFVRDNGIGFDMKYAHKLFGVFQRLHSDPQFEGTGVGLANVQRIIHRHGGRVWAEGEIENGATFYFSLPRGSGVRSGE